MSQMTPAAANDLFLHNALERNSYMPQYTINTPGQVLDIELDSVPGWAHAIDLSVYLDVNLAYTGAPSLSPFAPWNIFSEVQLSLGGGPFQRVSPFFYYLREMAMHDGWASDFSTKNYPYSNTTHFNIPAIASGDNFWRFSIRVPLQSQYDAVPGLIPLGSSSTKARLRLTVANNLYGSDQFLSPLYGGTGVTAAIGSAQTSYVQPNIYYLTTPAVKADLPDPQVGYVLNVQQKITQFVGAGSLTPIKFPDPFRYLRLWHIIIDGTGAPNTTGVSAFELDLTPGYPQYNYGSPGSLQQYFQRVRRTYNSDLPTGVFLFDLYAGSNPRNPNGGQLIDGAIFQTLQTQINTATNFNVSSPAKIITFAEALSPVGF